MGDDPKNLITEIAENGENRKGFRVSGFKLVIYP